jgi:hypothetical protein
MSARKALSSSARYGHVPYSASQNVNTRLYDFLVLSASRRHCFVPSNPGSEPPMCRSRVGAGTVLPMQTCQKFGRSGLAERQIPERGDSNVLRSPEAGRAHRVYTSCPNSHDRASIARRVRADPFSTARRSPADGVPWHLCSSVGLPAIGPAKPFSDPGIKSLDTNPAHLGPLRTR